MPPRPRGVRIRHADNTVTPCELAYVGIEDGLHTWAIMGTVHFGRGDAIEADVIPGETSIRFGVDPIELT